jgi:hypothetical protein
MRFVPTRIHGFVDYAMGAVLIAASLLTGGGAHTLASWLPVILGAGLIAYSLATDYELGMIRLIPMRTHLVLDAAGGVVLVLFALLSGRHGAGLLVPLVLGLLEIGSALVTRTTTGAGSGLERASGLAGDYRSMPAADGPRTTSLRPQSPTGTVAGNVEQLRRAIDSGERRDKVAMTDPAMAPLGSDDEAAAPHDEEGLRVARNGKDGSGPRDPRRDPGRDSGRDSGQP